MQIFFRTCIVSTVAFLCVFAPEAQAQTPESCYSDAFHRINSMLTGAHPLDFQKAVFITENAYYENRLNEKDFNGIVSFYASVCRDIIASGNIIYTEKDVDRAAAQCAVFTLMTDTIPIIVNNDTVITMPFAYNFDDFAGKKDWSSTFVSTLINTHKGNCHSLPYLYKMIMDELGQASYLSLAPNHIYIKAYNRRGGWYNIELTCGDFPTDAWLTASGYIHTDAIRNGIYMDTLSLRQSVTLCLVDLAQGYRAKFGVGDGSFIMRCCETALAHYPNYINALLLKVETLTALHRKSKDDKTILSQLNELLPHIHRLGYRKMPPDMYLNWLNSMGLNTVNYRMKSLLMNGEEIEGQK